MYPARHFLRDLRYSLRQVQRSPRMSATLILMLALGIGANAAVFSAIQALLLGRLPYRDADRLVIVWRSNPEIPGRNLVAFDAIRTWRQMGAVFEGVAATTCVR